MKTITTRKIFEASHQIHLMPIDTTNMKKYAPEYEYKCDKKFVIEFGYHKTLDDFGYDTDLKFGICIRRMVDITQKMMTLLKKIN